MMQPQHVIYSCHSSPAGGFSYYALYVYRPRSARAKAVVASWKADPYLGEAMIAGAACDVVVHWVTISPVTSAAGRCPHVRFSHSQFESQFSRSK
jgi:hypothetical protein